MTNLELRVAIRESLERAQWLVSHYKSRFIDTKTFRNERIQRLLSKHLSESVSLAKRIELPDISESETKTKRKPLHRSERTAAKIEHASAALGGAKEILRQHEEERSKDFDLAERLVPKKVEGLDD